MLFPMCNCGLNSHGQDPCAPAGPGAARDQQKPPVSKSLCLNTRMLILPSRCQYFFFFPGRNAVCLYNLDTHSCPQKEPLFILASKLEGYSGHGTLYTFWDTESIGHMWIQINSLNGIKLSCNSLNKHTTFYKGHFKWHTWLFQKRAFVHKENQNEYSKSERCLFQL